MRESFALIVIIAFLFLLRHHYHINALGLISGNAINSFEQHHDKTDPKRTALKKFYQASKNQSLNIDKILVESREKDNTIKHLLIELEKANLKIKDHGTSNIKSDNAIEQALRFNAPSTLTSINSNSNSDRFSSNYNSLTLNVSNTPLHEMCERRFGINLIDKWKQSEETWCSSSSNNSNDKNMKSELKCYPYHQEHKKLDGRGPDMFCVASNFIMDFSKIKGANDVPPAHKPALGSQYYSFEKNSLSSSCTKTDKWKSQLFMPHHSLQVNTFTKFLLHYN